VQAMTWTPDVYGPTVDEHTRCVHYATELDIIAIRFACCDRYYPLPLCAIPRLTDHPARTVATRASGTSPPSCARMCWTELTIDPLCQAGCEPLRIREEPEHHGHHPWIHC
jgi:uncharacterized CHY-type Zn-finger protein